ncbi:MAG: efflux RND transporter periplasmic adaptor subunit, partial [Syntrophomonadaceae bacterium]|nr:efflux RND transporter periplasmic adaptor subunit [Syntrophomonadaceae bacterium]
AIENGKVEEQLVEIGDLVSKGDVLLTLSNPDLSLQEDTYKISLLQTEQTYDMLQAELEGIKLDFAEAKNNYKRLEKLYNSGAISKVELEGARLSKDKHEASYNRQLNSIKQAEEQISIAQKALNNINAKAANLIITSPLEGTVVKLPVKEGQYVMVSEKLAEVASLNQMEIKAEILSDDMADIKIGQKVNISAPILKDAILAGELINIYPQAEEKLSALGIVQHRVPVIITLPESDILKIGYEVKIAIETLTKNNLIVIPREAIIYKDNDLKQVMLVDEKNRVSYVDIVTGLADRVNIEVISGLVEGQKIVLDASNPMKEGEKVKNH